MACAMTILLCRAYRLAAFEATKKHVWSRALDLALAVPRRTRAVGRVYSPPSEPPLRCASRTCRCLTPRAFLGCFHRPPAAALPRCTPRQLRRFTSPPCLGHCCSPNAGPAGNMAASCSCLNLLLPDATKYLSIHPLSTPLPEPISPTSSHACLVPDTCITLLHQST